MNTTQPKKRTKSCSKCGETFTASDHRQRTCPKCQEAKRAAKPKLHCIACGKEMETWKLCRRRCEECLAAYREESLSVYEAENLERRRDKVEILIELYMEKHGPTADNLTPRQHLALDRKIASLTKKVLAGKHPIHDEFYVLVCVIAYRRGALTQEHWAKMRRMHPQGDKWRNQMRELYKAVAGRPLKEQFSPFVSLNSYDLEPTLPMLRKLFDNPIGDISTIVEKAAPKPAQDDGKSDATFDKLTDTIAMIFYMQATPDRREKMRQRWVEKGYHHLLEMVGYEVPEPEPVEPEQVAHEDQGAIDLAAAELLDSIDWEI